MHIEFIKLKPAFYKKEIEEAKTPPEPPLCPWQQPLQQQLQPLLLLLLTRQHLGLKVELVLIAHCFELTLCAVAGVASALS